MSRFLIHPRLRSGALAVCGLALAAAGTLAVAAPSASSAPTASSAIAQRQANFKDMGKAMKLLKEQISSGSPDKTLTVAAAKTIAAKARLQGGLFPPGSGSSAGVKTDALDELWFKRPVFDGQMAQLVASADKLVGAASSGNADALAAQFTETGKACGACHRQFRADD